MPDTTVADNETDDIDDLDENEEESNSDDVEDGGISDETENEAPIAADTTPVPLPSLDPIVIPGLIRGLAKMIGVGGTLMLAIAKTAEDTLLVTIQPNTVKNESGAMAQPLQIAGTPEEIDAGMLEALGTYVPARNYAVATANEISRAIAVEADREKAERDKKAAKANAARAQPLTVKTTPVATTITLKPAAGAAGLPTHALTSGKAKNIPPGTYTLEVTAKMWQTKSQNVTIASKPVALEVELVPDTISLFNAAEQGAS